MGPGETFAFIAAIAGMAGTTITLALSWMRHRERMAGARSVGSGRLAETVAMLTETLERQHDRQTALAARLDALESAGSRSASRRPPQRRDGRRFGRWPRHHRAPPGARLTPAAARATSAR